MPRKPHPFGNEWHTIACGLSWIMFGVELVEGEDAQKEITQGLTKGTIGLLFRLTTILHNTGKVVVIDSGFCVLKGLVALCKVGVFSAVGIKNADTGHSLFQVTASTRQ